MTLPWGNPAPDEGTTRPQAADTLEARLARFALDPASPDRIAEITSHAQPVIPVCQEGYASSLAAASLQEIGLVNATDLDDGIVAWAAAGLPFRKGRALRSVDAPAVTRGGGMHRPAYVERTHRFRHSCRFC